MTILARVVILGVCVAVCASLCFLVSFFSPRKSWSQYQAGRLAGSVADYLLLHQNLTAVRQERGDLLYLRERQRDKGE